MVTSSKQILNVSTTPKQLTSSLFMSVFGALWGALEFGYNTGVINAPEKVIQNFINETQYERNGVGFSSDSLSVIWGITVGIFAIGGMAGGISAGFWANRFGRKRALLCNNFVGLLAAVFMGVSKPAKSYEMLIIGRVLVGFCSGLFTGLTPMYIMEVAPKTLRGAFGTVNQLGVTLGICLSMVLGLGEILGNEYWPYLLALSGAPCVFQLLILPFCPESPRYLLITKNEEKAATEALVRLRDSEDVEDELNEMRAEAEADASETKVSIIGLLQSNSLRWPLIISVVMQLSQQLSGINAIFYYSNSVFTGAGIPKSQAGYATVGVGIIMVVNTLVSIPLMDRAGRKTLHLVGLGGMCIFSVVMTVMLVYKNAVDWFKYIQLVATYLYVFFFAIGPGSIPWIIVNELFSQGPRGSATSIAVLVNWSSNFVVGFAFKPLQENLLYDYCFIPFTILLAIFFAFTYFKLPETKNRSFEEISALFRNRTGGGSVSYQNGKDKDVYGGENYDEGHSVELWRDR